MALPAEGALGSLLQRGAANAPALIDAGVTWKYADLRAEVARQAAPNGKVLKHGLE